MREDPSSSVCLRGHMEADSRWIETKPWLLAPCGTQQGSYIAAPISWNLVAHGG